MSTIIVNQKEHGCLVQCLWFFCIGFWAGQIWIILSWLAMLTIIGIPLGVKMLNKLPRIIALRSVEQSMTITSIGGVTLVSHGASVPQHNILLRAIWFVVVGWWASAIWMELAYLACLTLIGLPIGFWMFDRVPVLVSLRKRS